MISAPPVVEQFCFVSCGLPGDQCACFRGMMAKLYGDLLERQALLDTDLDRIWSENVEELYQS